MSLSESPRTLAIVLNWRQPEETLECVKALRAMQESPLDVLVIDNGSGDNSVDILGEQQEMFRFLSLADNLGFAAGNNKGLRLALAEGYDYALLVNNDAYAAPDMLANLLAETDVDIALLSPKIFYEGETNRIWFANGRQRPLLLDLIETGQGEFDGPRWRTSRDVDYLLGTCLLVNLPIARKVGLLDERYFFYFEDLDWSIRLRQAGYRLRLVADAHLAHREAFSTGGEVDSPLRRYYLAYSGTLFWRQHARLGNPPLIFMFRLLSAFKMMVRLMLAGRRDVAKAYLRGLRDGWRDSN